MPLSKYSVFPGAICTCGTLFTTFGIENQRSNNNQNGLSVKNSALYKFKKYNVQ